MILVREADVTFHTLTLSVNNSESDGSRCWAFDGKQSLAGSCISAKHPALKYPSALRALPSPRRRWGELPVLKVFPGERLAQAVAAGAALPRSCLA